MSNNNNDLPGRQSDHPHNAEDEHIETEEVFEPIPYSFNLKDASGNDISVSSAITGMAQSPPLHILVDHLIAVLWCFYAQNRKLGTAQIDWALKILEGNRDRMGRYSEDVELAIEHLEQILIETYITSENEKEVEDEDAPSSKINQPKSVRLPSTRIVDKSAGYTSFEKGIINSSAANSSHVSSYLPKSFVLDEMCNKHPDLLRNIQINRGEEKPSISGEMRTENFKVVCELETEPKFIGTDSKNVSITPTEFVNNHEKFAHLLEKVKDLCSFVQSKNNEKESEQYSKSQD